MAPQTADIEFRASDLIGPAGTGSNGEKLVNTLLDHYPEPLQAALMKRINPGLDAKIDDRTLGQVAKIAGVPRVEGAHVRGGFSRTDEAVVTYAFLDDRGTVFKGCFPLSDLGSGSSDKHVSQRDSLANSATGQQHIAENPRPAGAAADGSAPEPVDPYDALESASAEDLVAQMREHPERANAIKAFEKAVRGNRARKSVLEFDPKADASS